MPPENERHEKFAQLVATGVEYGKAWAETAQAGHRPARKSSNSAGHRVAARPEVAARIRHLTGLRAEKRPVLLRLESVGDVMALSERLSGALNDLYTRLGVEGADEASLASTRALMASHAQRCLDLAKLRGTPSAPREPEIMMLNMGGPHECEC